MSLFDLTGKVAVVTGATKGIGLGIVQQMALQGARLVVSSRNQAECDALAETLNSQYGKGGAVAKGIACDIDKLEDIEALAKGATEAFGGVDILVCNAAVLPFIGPAADTPVALFDRIVTSNTHHNFRLCEALRGPIASRGGGSIILIGSIAGHSPSPSLMAYAIAKAGVSHMARCLADEMAAQRIRVNCVAPGFIHSFSSQPIVDNVAAMKVIEAGIPLGRIGEPEDIAGAVIFLASNAGAYVTGETLLVDGGNANLSKPSDGKGALDAIEPGKSYN